MKVVTVVGARPQFVKAAVVSRALLSSGRVEEVLIHTGQHYDENMSEIFFEQMGIMPPRYNLAIGGVSHGAMTGRQLEKIEEVLMVERPDLVLVYGDTNSTLSGALAAAKLHIPVAHVEAGLRSFNRRMPEELNRVVTDHLSTLLFAPTDAAVDNLAREGVDRNKVHAVGDVMYDVALYFRERATKPKWFDQQLGDAPRFALATIHREENTDDPAKLTGIFEGLSTYEGKVVLPLHPRTRGRIEELGAAMGRNLLLVPPVGYLEMVWLETHCELILTDSGGVQKEAYFHGKPCITLREETEWVELLEAKANILVGADPSRIATGLRKPPTVEGRIGIFGNGDSAMKIANVIMGAGWHA